MDAEAVDSCLVHHEDDDIDRSSRLSHVPDRPSISDFSGLTMLPLPPTMWVREVDAADATSRRIAEGEQEREGADAGEASETRDPEAKEKEEEEEEEEEDDGFGDFGSAQPASSAPPAAVHVPVPPPPPPPEVLPPSDPDLLDLTDEQFLEAAWSAWGGGEGQGPIAVEECDAVTPLLSHLRSIMRPFVAPELGKAELATSVLSLGGIPIATVKVSSTPALPNLRAFLGHQYQPSVRGDTAPLKWRGSESERRLLTSLGLLEISRQITREQEESQRLMRRGTRRIATSER